MRKGAAGVFSPYTICKEKTNFFHGPQKLNQNEPIHFQIFYLLLQTNINKLQNQLKTAIRSVRVVLSLQYRTETGRPFWVYKNIITKKINDTHMEGNNIYISDTDDQIMPKVLSNISDVLFGEKKNKDFLLKRYQEMQEQCNWEYPDGPTDNGCAVKYVDAPQGYQDYNILGFDIPTLITLGKHPTISSIVMVVSQDPKRTERYRGMLSLSSPFGFHDKSYRGNSRKGFMTPLICMALEECPNTALYFTDCNKLFTTDPKGILKTETNKYLEILKKEIELIKPSCIIAHGKAAENFLKKINCAYKYIPYIGNSYMKREDKEQAKVKFINAITTKK